MTTPTPDHIMKMASGFGISRALQTAVGLGLYSRLAAGSMTLAEITHEYGLAYRPAMDFLDLLVSADLLRRDCDGEDARYCNTDATALYLIRNQPNYIGGIIELWDQRNYRFWVGLAEGLKTGQTQSETKYADTPFFETLYADPERLEDFMQAMNGASIRNFQALAEAFPFGDYSSLVDIGGADALLSRCIAAKHPHLHCTSFDLPAVSEIARRRISEANLGGQIEAVSGDFFSGPLPPADIITMGMILHDWDLDRKKLLVQKAYSALPVGGAFIIIEALIDDARRDNTFGMFLSLNMMIELGDAFDFTGAEFIDWCREAGFGKFEFVPLTGPSTAAVAYKL